LGRGRNQERKILILDIKRTLYVLKNYCQAREYMKMAYVSI
jgi:hypothetical protein